MHLHREIHDSMFEVSFLWYLYNELLLDKYSEGRFEKLEQLDSINIHLRPPNTETNVFLTASINRLTLYKWETYLSRF